MTPSSITTGFVLRASTRRRWGNSELPSAFALCGRCICVPVRSAMRFTIHVGKAWKYARESVIAAVALGAKGHVKSNIFNWKAFREKLFKRGFRFIFGAHVPPSLHCKAVWRSAVQRALLPVRGDLLCTVDCAWREQGLAIQAAAGTGGT